MEEITYYKLDDIAVNNGKKTDKTWILIKTEVYDVTDYMKDHPGGPELIEDYAGKDATSAFHDSGHSSDARKLLKSFKIGEIHPDELRNNSQRIEESTSTKTGVFSTYYLVDYVVELDGE